MVCRRGRARGARQSRWSAWSDVYKGQVEVCVFAAGGGCGVWSKLFLTEALMP